MIHAIRKIDRALKSFYRLENSFPAEMFLVGQKTLAPKGIGSALGSGALLILEQPSAGEPFLELGIYFDKSVKSELSEFEKWPRAEWTCSQTLAFSVAAEEVSHFNYLVERARQDRPVTELEMELQGEVDRFVLAFLAERHQRKAPSFEELFAKYFENFRWDARLDATKRSRYEDAHRMAKSLVMRLRPAFKNHRRWPELVSELRRFYRASHSEKVKF